MWHLPPQPCLAARLQKKLNVMCAYYGSPGHEAWLWIQKLAYIKRKTTHLVLVA
jgi:hypothetical protein